MRRHKYNATKVRYDGYIFDSTGEATRYKQLKDMEEKGEIEELRVHPVYPIVINDKPVKIRSDGYPNGRSVKYKADFDYEYTGTGVKVIEDFKGMDTPMSRLKRALVEAIYGIEVKVI